MSMATTADMRLDGNGVAGLLQEVFAMEATAALVSCAHCGSVGAVGSAEVYAHAPGVVLRCPECTEVVMRFARVRGRLVADLRGVGRLSVESPSS
jgi:ssDNA-binding replication factor A large subunit